MENNNTNNKLDYISELNKYKSLRKTRRIDSGEAEAELDFRKNVKSFKECITFYKNKMKTQSEDDLSLVKLDTLDKKLRVLKAYMNLVLFVISLKYLDIIIKVKHGGIIFSIGFICLFQSSNKKFNEYHDYLIFKELAEINHATPNKILHDYINTKKSQSDEEKLRKISLKKYWKEPMAWH